jgi:hypothetical protein
VAGVSGLEPEPKVLETSMLTIDTIPLKRFSICDCRFAILFGISAQSQIANCKSKITLLIFPMQSVATATAAKLFEFQPSRRILFVFRRYIIALFTLGALQNYVISWHYFVLCPLSFALRFYK